MTAPSVRRLLAGWRLSSEVIAFYVISSFLGGLISLDSTGSRDARVLVASAGASVLVGTCLAGLSHVWRAMGEPCRKRGVLRFVIVGVGTGAVRAVGLLSVASALGVAPPAGAALLIVNSIVSAIVWLGLGGLIVSSRDAYRARYAELLARGARVNRDGYPLMDWDSLPDVQRMKSTLHSVVLSTVGQPSAEELARASAALREEIESNLRPLSRRLWFGDPEEVPHVRWTYTLRDAVAGFTVPVVPITVLWLVGSVVGGASLLGPLRGVLAAVLSAIVLAVMLGFWRRVVGRRPGVLTGSAAVVTSAFAPILIADATLRALGFESSLLWTNGLLVLLPTALLGILLAGAAIALADADRMTVLAVAGQRPRGDVVRGIDTGEASTYVHNSLQSELTGIAMQLEAAARSSDGAAARSALERAQSLLGRSINEDFASFQEDPIARADRVSRAWTGICSVTVRVAPEAHADPRLALAVRSGEELISNAVRHSGAQRVHLDISRVGASLEVTCDSDTVGDPHGAPGLGAHLLAATSTSGVSTARAGNGTRYQVRVE